MDWISSHTGHISTRHHTPALRTVHSLSIENIHTYDDEFSENGLARRWTGLPTISDLPSEGLRNHYEEHARVATLCPTCRSIDIEVREGQSKRYGRIVDALQSAKKCPLCKLLHKHLESEAPDELVEVHFVPVYAATIQGGKSSKISGFSFRNGTKFCHLSFSVSSVNPASAEIKRHPPVTSYDSEQAYQLARRWIQDCTEHHEHCPAKHDAPLPTRVIEVCRPGHNPKLHVPEPGSKGRYAALSYCWGHTQAKILTQDLLHKGNVSWALNTLPPTLRDAVVICRNLGFEYLWIDALCIIQDSRRGVDWEHESAKMDQIYGNAALVIAAAAANATSKGIFACLSPKDPPSCSIPYRTSDGQATTVDVDAYDIEDPPHEPLDSRAWAFQEALLSTRLLRYGKSQMTWRCQKLEENANGPLINWSVPPNRDNRSWPNAVTDYTSRNLTYSSDRLAAIAGYAKSLAHRNPYDSYIAGLWRSELLEQLCWYRRIRSPPQPRPPYRAPSWSWASIDGPVQFSTCPSDLRTPVEILEVQVPPAGRLEHSPKYLRLSGFIKLINSEDFFPQKDHHSLLFYGRDKEGLPVIGEAGEAIMDVYDHFKGVPPQSREYGLRCLKMSETCGLILKVVWKDGVSDLYERCGLATGGMFSRWFVDHRCGSFVEGIVSII